MGDSEMGLSFVVSRLGCAVAVFGRKTPVILHLKEGVVIDRTGLRCPVRSAFQELDTSQHSI